jgi:hypothetical protein
MPAKLTVPRQSERSFASQVDQLAALMGWKTYRTWISIRSPAGFPDRVFARPPRLLFVELKRVGGKLRPAQADWLRWLEDCKQEVYLWTPETWTEIERKLAR